MPRGKRKRSVRVRTRSGRNNVPNDVTLNPVEETIGSELEDISRDVNEPSQARFWLEPARKFAGSSSARLENLPARFWLGLEMARK